MKQANRAPAYAMLYPGLCDVARDLGYALTIHGSVVTDLDLVAIPWTDEAVEPIILKDAIKTHCGRCLTNLDEFSVEHEEPEMKPHGRLAWKLHMYAGGSVDLSVIPIK